MSNLEDVMGNIMREVRETHTLWWSLVDYLKRFYFTLEHGHKKDFTASKRKYRVVDMGAVKGYRAMVRMDRFCVEHPEVVGVPCDDHIHSSSSIYLIPHDGGVGRFMGITFLYVSQNAPEQNCLFLYPNEIRGLIEALQVYADREDRTGE